VSVPTASFGKHVVVWDGSKTSKVTSKALLVRIVTLDSFFEEVSCVFSCNV